MIYVILISVMIEHVYWNQLLKKAGEAMKNNLHSEAVHAASGKMMLCLLSHLRV